MFPLLILNGPETCLVSCMPRKSKRSVTVEQMAQTLLKACVLDVKAQLRVAAESKAVELNAWLNEKIVPELNRIMQALEQSVRPAPKPVKARSSVKRARTAT